MEEDPDLKKIAELAARWPGNIAIQSFDPDYYKSLSPQLKARLLKCLSSGIDNPDSEMGCYACHPCDYDELKPFFSMVLAQHHNVATDARHASDWNLPGIDGTPEDGVLDLARHGLPPLSMRIRVGRNLLDFPLPGSMTRDDRIALEKRMVKAFDQLIAMPEYGGAYYSLTPDHPNLISTAQYQELVDVHIMFKNMDSDRFLTAAGIGVDWPYGRGCYVSQDQETIIWVGEEDHLRVMCMSKGTVLNRPFDKLKSTLDTIKDFGDVEFAFSEDYGAVTSCPTNLGTGMRASLHTQLPNLTADGTDERAKAIAKPLGLSIRGADGEHTAIGEDGTVDVSPSARFCISEAEIITRLYNGVAALKAAEENASRSA